MKFFEGLKLVCVFEITHTHRVKYIYHFSLIFTNFFHFLKNI